ncbi:MAG: FtsW/RodA/SpoVE family cell cycle protein, partial [Verrucomicrobia bacterium]|nr:FtsW/RodA/SpoVE family cell cycle protein [Verrucomicrobiota bacterium]
MSPKTRISSWAFRTIERHLIGIIAIALSAGFLTLFIKRLPPGAGFSLSTIPALAPLAACLGAMAITHLILVFAGSRSTPLLVPAVLLLAGLGVLLRYRSGLPFDLTSLSVLAYPAGLMVMLATAIVFKRGGTRSLAGLGWLAWAASVALMAALLLLGTRFRGAVFAGGNLTPTELLKPFMIIFIAAWLAPHLKSLQRDRAMIPPQSSGLVILAWGVLMALLAWQRDLGMMLMLNATLLLMLYAASANVNVLLTGGALVAVAGFAATFIPHVKGRFVAWLSPWEAPTGSGWQILQSLSALYSGGLLGSGLGDGDARAIPVASSDFIYASLGEELGYIGCGLVIVCNLLIWREAFHISGTRKDPFERL